MVNMSQDGMEASAICRILKVSVSYIGTDVEMEVLNRQIIIRPAKYPRHDWEEAFRNMRANA